jgi:signal transduction histidine kinase
VASQAAIDSLPDPVLVVDPSGAILNLNGAAESMLRLGAGDGPATLAALEPELRAVVERVRHHVLSGRGPYVPRGFEEAVRVSSPEGDRHLLPRATPLYSEQGGVAGVTIVLQDVTRLMRFDELKNDLVATVAHEFRTPLTSLRMAIHLCADETVGPLTEKQADLMAAAREDCERLQGIVDDLLDLSRIQSGRMALQRARVDAGTLLVEAAAALRAAGQDAGVEILVTPPVPPAEVEADPERAGLVLANLLANALRHTPRGGTVEARAAPAGDAVRFEVHDTGEGIAREHLESDLREVLPRARVPLERRRPGALHLPRDRDRSRRRHGRGERAGPREHVLVHPPAPGGVPGLAGGGVNGATFRAVPISSRERARARARPLRRRRSRPVPAPGDPRSRPVNAPAPESEASPFLPLTPTANGSSMDGTARWVSVLGS